VIPADLLATYGLLALFVVMLLKEIGVPVPIPSDLIMITAGVQLAAGTFGILELVIAVELAILLGCSTHFFVIRAAGRRVIRRFGRFVGLTESRLEQAAAMIRRRGPLAVFLALNVPAARAGVIAAAGIAGLRYGTFAPPMVAGNSFFYGWHIALGFVAGPVALGLLEQMNASLLLVFVVLALLGLAGWFLLRRRRGADAASDALEQLHTWTQAACPGCLALTAVGVHVPGAEPR
jgi:LPXTG-motif cell wall-anchored protein